MSETDLLFPLQFPRQLEVGILFFEARHLSKGPCLVLGRLLQLQCWRAGARRCARGTKFTTVYIKSVCSLLRPSWPVDVTGFKVRTPGRC